MITIGNHVRITKGVCFVTYDGVWVFHNLGLENANIFGKTEIGDNVHIGWNAIIMPNLSIGNDEYYMKVQGKSICTKTLSWEKKERIFNKSMENDNMEPRVIKSKKTKKNTQIEGLRGIAILIIVIFHIFDRFQQIYFERSIVWMNNFGTFGTTIFLLISAFFLMSSNQTIHTFREAVSAFSKKLIRLWPCYAVCVTITFLLSRVLYLPERTVGWIDYLFNILLLNRFFNIPFVDGAHWYLGVLLSATIILIVFEWFKLKNNPVAYLVWIGLEVLVDYCGIFKEAYILGGPFVGCICIGIAIRAIYENLIKEEQNKNTDGWIIVILLSLMYTGWARGLVCMFEILIVTPIFVLVIFEKANIFDFRVFRKIGESSYPIYLIHQNIGFMLEWLLIKHFNDWNYFIPTIVFIVSLAIGIIIFYLIERPIQKRIKG